MLLQMLAFLPAQVLRGIKAKPVQTLQILAIVGLVAAAVFFWFDYRGAKEDVATLRERLRVERAQSEQARDRIEEFVAAQKLQARRIREMEQAQAEARQRIREITDSLSEDEIERVLKEQPDEADRIVSDRLSDLFGMFDNATARAGASAVTEGGDLGSSGADPN